MSNLSEDDTRRVLLGTLEDAANLLFESASRDLAKNKKSFGGIVMVFGAEGAASIKLDQDRATDPGYFDVEVPLQVAMYAGAERFALVMCCVDEDYPEGDPNRFTLGVTMADITGAHTEIRALKMEDKSPVGVSDQVLRKINKPGSVPRIFNYAIRRLLDEHNEKTEKRGTVH